MWVNELGSSVWAWISGGWQRTVMPPAAVALLLTLSALGCRKQDPKPELTAAPSTEAVQADRGLARPVGSSLEVAGTMARTALVIGNGSYRDGPLKNPVNDAKDVAAALKKLGFEVAELADASQKGMKQAIRDFGRRLEQRKGAALFYYSGHGVQANGRNYLIPVDAEIDSEQAVDLEAMTADSVLGVMDAAQTQINFVFLDACRNNPFARSFRSPSQGLAYMDAPSGTLIAYATAPGRTASDGTARNGTYTEALLRHLPNPELSVSQMLMRVGVDVEAITARQQVPWHAQSLRGEFYFGRLKQEAQFTPESNTAPAANTAPLSPGGKKPPSSSGPSSRKPDEVSTATPQPSTPAGPTTTGPIREVTPLNPNLNIKDLSAARLPKDVAIKDPSIIATSAVNKRPPTAVVNP
jgi:Caspase domain